MSITTKIFLLLFPVMTHSHPELITVLISITSNYFAYLELHMSRIIRYVLLCMYSLINTDL